MRILLITAIAGLLAMTPRLLAEEFPCRSIVLGVSFHVDGSTYVGDTRFECRDEYANPYNGEFSAESSVVDDTDHATVAEDSCQSCQEQVLVLATGGSSTPNHCYICKGSATSSFGTWHNGSPTMCAPPPPPPPPDGQDDGSQCVPGGIGCGSPIVVAMTSASYALTPPRSGVHFDLRNEGIPRLVAWTRPYSDTAFLALDRNGNGTIDNGSELFGNFTPLSAGGLASNGFEALAEFDENDDGLIDYRDAGWQSLLLWTDRDHDGLSSPPELQSISDSAISSLGTGYKVVERRDSQGNLFQYMAKFQIRRERKAVGRPYYDVFLQIDR
jgi:hypothetical protein